MLKTMRHIWWRIRELLGIRPFPWLAEFCDEVPDCPEQGTVYIVGEDDVWWCVALACPCGCGRTIQLNVLPQASPRWSFSVHDDGTISLSPSVWGTRGCKSHFFLKAGYIQWCSDDSGDHAW